MMTKRQLKKVFFGLCGFILLACTSSCAVDPISGKREFMLLSEADELTLGKQTDKEVIQQYGIYEDSGLTAYVGDICGKLGKLSHRPQVDYQFKILDTSVVNAFAVPGGYVYFTRGILASLNSEAELAGIMGHEIGHVAARHSAEQYTRAQMAQIGLGMGMVLAPEFRYFADLAQFGVGMLFLSYSRDNEREADDLGVEYASKAGYDATQMAGFFDTLERMHPKSDRSGLPDWFSTHPNPAERQATVRKRAKEWQGRLGAKEWKIDREGYLKRIDGLVFGEDPRQGYEENGVFYHPVLKFQFPVPAQWTLQNTRSLIRMVTKKGDAIILFGLTPARSEGEAARNFVKGSKASVIDSKRTSVNGSPAHRLLTQIRRKDGVLQLLSYFIQKDGKIYVFHGVTAPKGYAGYAPIFQNTMTGFRDLTDPEKIHVRPDRIRIRYAPKAGTVRQVLAALGTPGEQLESVALLNGKRLDDPIQARTALKLVEKGR